ncbi:MAG: repeat protein [Nevskia sp.]|nr:repeat protein [Nevskia sp.]
METLLQHLPQSARPAPAAPLPMRLNGGFSHPQMSRFIAEVERRYRRDDIDSFWELEDEFRQLVQSDAVLQFLRQELAQMVETPARIGQWRPNQLIIHRGRGFALSVWMVEQERRYIHSTSFLGMCAPIGADCLDYAIYKLPPDYRNSMFDPAVKLEPAGTGLTAPGGVLLLQSKQYAYDFQGTRPQPVLKFATASFEPMEWLFSKDSLQAWQANDSELVWTQLRVAAYVLGRLADESSRAPLEQLSSHPNHAVRWAVIQSLGRLSRSAVMPKLETAINDPHPHIRRAAARTLQQLALTQ